MDTNTKIQLVTASVALLSAIHEMLSPKSLNESINEIKKEITAEKANKAIKTDRNRPW